MGAQVGRGGTGGALAPVRVGERDDVVFPPRECGVGVEGAAPRRLAQPLGDGPSAGMLGEFGVAGRVVEPQVSRGRVGQGHHVEERAFAGFDLQVGAAQAGAGEGDGAQRAHLRVDRELSAGPGDRDAVVAVDDEIELAHAHQLDGGQRGTGGDQLGDPVPSPTQRRIERAELPVEVARAGQGADHQVQRHGFGAAPRRGCRLLAGAAQGAHGLVESQRRLHRGVRPARERPAAAGNPEPRLPGPAGHGARRALWVTESLGVRRRRRARET